MLSSMTGFGRAVLNAPFGKLVVEIQSVNRKYLEIFVSLPKEFSRFEIEVRKWVGEAISRGQVSIRVFLIPSGEVLLPDASILKEFRKGWEKLARDLGIDLKEITLPFLMKYLPTQPAREEEIAPLRSGIEKALQDLLQMKREEGKALAQDLGKRLKELERLIKVVEQCAPDATEKMRERLFEKVEEVLKPGVELEERLLREVALFAERTDISEEITRFRSHISQFLELLKSAVVGRKMDFLIQEMGREINTVGSKSMEAKISHLVVDLKSELEKMREQVQNVE